jgi:hypothetical protein
MAAAVAEMQEAGAALKFTAALVVAGEAVA